MTSVSFTTFSQGLSEAISYRDSFTCKPNCLTDKFLLYQAGIMRATASWDSYINNLVRESLSKTRKANPHRYVFAQQIMEDQSQRLLDKFNNPNKENTQKLFQEVLGHDPCISWGRPRARKSAYEIGLQLNEVMKVRHSIAHGFSMPAFMWNQDSKGSPIASAKSLNWVVLLLKHIASETDKSVAKHLELSMQMPRPW